MDIIITRLNSEAVVIRGLECPHGDVSFDITTEEGKTNILKRILYDSLAAVTPESRISNGMAWLDKVIHLAHEEQFTSCEKRLVENMKRWATDLLYPAKIGRKHGTLGSRCP